MLDEAVGVETAEVEISGVDVGAGVEVATETTTEELAVVALAVLVDFAELMHEQALEILEALEHLAAKDGKLVTDVLV